VVQLSAYIDGMIASFLGTAAVSGLAYAQTLYLLPIGLFGMSVAAAELPEMSSASASDKLCERLVSGRRKIAFFVIPSVVAFVFLGKWIVAALYQTGAFGPEDTRYIWYILLGSVVGLLAATWGRIYSSAFYALGDTKTPLYFALVRVTLTTVLGLLLAFPLRSYLTEVLVALHMPLPQLPNIELGLGAVGLTASAGFAGWIEFLLLKRSLTKKIGSSAISFSYQLLLWGIALFAAAMAILGAPLLHRAMEALGLGALHHSLESLLVIGVYGLVYLGLARLATRR
jgi:putative peptidoglycan lipid II flippase